MIKNTYTYLGTVDDLAQRYPWDIKVDLKHFNNMLIRKALLGEKIIINDGYLLNLPAAREALLHPEISPLKALIEANFVRILSRNNSLVDLPEKMSAQGVESFRLLSQSNQWTELKAMLNRWQPLLQQNNNFLPWPKKHISHGFDIMMMRLHQQPIENLGLQHTSADTLQRVFDHYIKQNHQDKEATRTRWEKSVIEIHKASPDRHLAINELMGLACEAYHYNFGICLTDYAQLQHANILVETRYSQAFDEFMRMEHPPEQMQINIPALKIPQNLPLQSNELWKQIADPFSDVAAIQQQYKTTMDLYFAGQTNDDALSAAAKEYSVALSTHFGQAKEVQGITKTALSVGFLGLGTLAGPITASLLWLSENHLLPTVLRKFNVRDREFFTESSKELAKVDITNKKAITSIALDNEKAKQLSRDIPSF